MKKEEIHKAIAVPVTFVDEKPKFLTVRDRRHKEWIFVTGGCRKREVSDPIHCALRELEEETRGVLRLKSGIYTNFKFETTTTRGHLSRISIAYLPSKYSMWLASNDKNDIPRCHSLREIKRKGRIFH